MKFSVSEQIRAVHFPPISEVRSWAAHCESSLPLIDLCQAVPDYPPAREMTDHLASLLSDPEMARYSPDEGLLDVREAICKRYRRRYNARIHPGHLCLTIGASQAFWLAVVTLCRPGDEVIVQVPYYFDHAMALDILGITRINAPFSEEHGGLPSISQIAALLSSRTKAILLVTPSNPTGAITPPGMLDELAALARAHGIAFILDETYSDFLPGDVSPHNLFTQSHWDDNFIHVTSFGKTYALTGYRAGLLAASPRFIHHALKAQDTMAVCQPRITQHAIKYGVNNLDEWVAVNRGMMEARHRRFCDEFAKPGNAFRIVASGAFFAWVRHPCCGSSGRDVAKRLVHETGALTLPGEVFGPGLEPYLRLAFGNITEAAIPEAAARFRSFSP